MSGVNEEDVRKESIKLLEKFSKTLGKVKSLGDSSGGKASPQQKEDGFRIEGEGLIGDTDFRKRMFDNAEKKDENYIYAEKKKW